MAGGGRTPEELETLLEDAFVLGDHLALMPLFEPAAVLAAGGGLEEARGHREIARAAAALWDSQHTYLADPRRVLQAGDIALVLGGRAISVARRGGDGSWRYAISIRQGLGPPGLDAMSMFADNVGLPPDAPTPNPARPSGRARRKKAS